MTNKAIDIQQLILKTAVDHSKLPFSLSLSKGVREFGMITKRVGEWKPPMLRQAQHERLPLASTAVFRLIALSRTMLEKAREESWDDVFVLEAERSELIRLFFFRTGSAGICGYGCGRNSNDNGDGSR